MTDVGAAADAICRAVRDRDGNLDALVDEALKSLAPLATTSERERIREVAIARMTGLDALDALLTDPTVDEVLVNGHEVWVDRGGTVAHVGDLTGPSIEELIERILAPLGRRVDRTSPIVDARLQNGSRVCAVVAPVATNGAALAIRRFSQQVRPLRDFTDEVGAELLGEIVATRCNLVTCGATSSGKTSLLAAMLAEVGTDERLVVLEDTAELPCDSPHQVRLEARPASAEGLGAVTLADLVKTALRLRPDRLVVGEVRSDECIALVQAMNTGHDGSFSTCHANSPLDALLRLESLVLQAAPQWPLHAVRQQLARSIDVIVHVERSGASRRVTQIAEVEIPGDGEGCSVRPLGHFVHGRFERLASLSRGRA